MYRGKILVYVTPWSLNKLRRNLRILHRLVDVDYKTLSNRNSATKFLGLPTLRLFSKFLTKCSQFYQWILSKDHISMPNLIVDRFSITVSVGWSVV